MILVRLTAVLLVASSVNLALMVPGGFVETRIFTQYPIWIIAGFNVVLSVLGLGSLILAARIWRNGSVGLVSLFAGLLFALVYLIDLAELFPISESPMSKLLFTLEWIGTVLGLALAVVGWRAHVQTRSNVQERAFLPRSALIFLAVLVLLIVGFSTLKALG